MTSTLITSRTLAELIEDVGGPVVCLAMSKDPNAKVTLLLFRRGEPQPAYAVKIPTTDQAVGSVEREAATLSALAHLDLGPVRYTVPTVVDTVEHGGRPALVTTAVGGRQMLAAYHTWRHTSRAPSVTSDMAAAASWLAALHSHTAGTSTDLATMLDGVFAVIGRRFGDDPQTAADLAALASLTSQLSGHRVARTVLHGDFWPGNLMVAAGQVHGVVDWENARTDGLPTRDLARFAVTYSLYLDRHTRPGRPVRGHLGMRAGPWGAGLEHAICGTGWYPELVRRFVADGLQRLSVPGALARAVLLAEVACIAAEADHPEFARSHLLLLRRLRVAGQL